MVSSDLRYLQEFSIYGMLCNSKRRFENIDHKVCSVPGLPPPYTWQLERFHTIGKVSARGSTLSSCSLGTGATLWNIACEFGQAPTTAWDARDGRCGL